MSNYLLKGLEGLRKRRQNIVPLPISDEVLQDLFLETMQKINNSYVAGTIKYIEDNHKDLDARIDEADDKINEVWQLCIEGKSGLDDFRNALNLYKILYLKAIRLYKSKTEWVK
jgi:hypothetical protein